MAKKEQRFIKVAEESGIINNSEVWADTQTGVQYFYHASGQLRRHVRTGRCRGQTPAVPQGPGRAGVLRECARALNPQGCFRILSSGGASDFERSGASRF